MNKKLKIAITGGIGTGKSKVAEIIESLGYLVIKADDVSKHFLFNHPETQKKLVEEFGSDVHKDGKVNVQFLRNVVFSSDKNTKIANSILHPPTISKIDQLMAEELQHNDLVFVEAALIFEANMENMFDEIIAVTSDKEIRFKRIIKRDGKSIEQIAAIMKKQMPNKEKEQKSSITIQNDSDFETLKMKTIEIVRNLEKKSKE